MMNLKDQLARAIGNMLVANIPTENFTMDVESTYLTGDRVECIECEAGEALLLTTHDVFEVTVKDGEVLELDAYMVMDPYEQSIWDTLYKNGLLSKLYKRVDTDNDGIGDTIYQFNTVKDTYTPTPGSNYYHKEDLINLAEMGNLDPRLFNTLRDDVPDKVMVDSIPLPTGADNNQAIQEVVNDAFGNFMGIIAGKRV